LQQLFPRSAQYLPTDWDTDCTSSPGCNTFTFIAKAHQTRPNQSAGFFDYNEEHTPPGATIWPLQTVRQPGKPILSKSLTARKQKLPSAPKQMLRQK